MSINNIEPQGVETVLTYVVSADVAGLMGRWATQNGLLVPNEEFFAGVTNELADRLAIATNGPVEIVPQKEMFEGMDKLVSESPYPVISLDRAYFDDDHARIAGFMDVTRAVKEVIDERGTRTFESIKGLTPRPGAPSVEEQTAQLKKTLGSTPVTLVDDVVFSGETPAMVVEALAAAGIPVARFITGIGIQAGIDKLTEAGVEVICVKKYDDVADEVCERDFVVGVPMSGRTVIGDNGEHWSAPYMTPYGNAEKWGSIPPEAVREFSRFCIAQSLRVWAEVERLSGVTIPANAVPRPLKGADNSPMTRVLWNDYLKHQ